MNTRGKWAREPYDAKKLFARLFKHRIIDPATDCWLWPNVNTSGYGQMFFDHHGRKFCVRLHRISAWLYLGYDGNPKKQIAHRCNIKACWNPGHLYIATPEQNIRDAIRDGLLTHRRGANHYEARFSEEQIRDIRRRAAAGESNADMGREFRVNRATIRRIVTRQTWKHLKDEVLQ